MVFAAGLGTRLKPLTDSLPKALVKVYDRPMLEWVILRLKQFGFSDIIINVHHHADKIIDFLKISDNFGLNIKISYEKELLDTGGGLKKAAWFFEDSTDLLLHNTDILSDINLHQLIKDHQGMKADATLVVRNRKSNRYLLFDQNRQLCGWHSVKDNKIIWVNEANDNFDEYAFSGIHVISAKLLKQFQTGNVFSIIPEYIRWAKHFSVQANIADNTKWIDLGKKENLNKAADLFGSKYFEQLTHLR